MGSLRVSQCFPTQTTKFRIHLKARAPTPTHLPTDKTFFLFQTVTEVVKVKCEVVPYLRAYLLTLWCHKCFFFLCGEGLIEGCSESDPVKAILFCLQGVGTTITVAQVCHDFCITSVVPFVFLYCCFSFTITPLCMFTDTLDNVKHSFSSTAEPDKLLSRSIFGVHSNTNSSFFRNQICIFQDFYFNI